MTVGELIEQLRAIPADTEVYLSEGLEKRYELLGLLIGMEDANRGVVLFGGKLPPGLAAKLGDAQQVN